MSEDQPPTVPVERTSLAWTRTMLAYAGCALLAARLVAGSAVLVVTMLGAAGAGTAALAVAARTRRAAAARGRPAPVATAVPAVLTTALGLAVAVLVVLR